MPRVTDDSVEKTHARLRSIFAHAAASGELQHRGYMMGSLLPRFREEVTVLENQRQDRLDMRVTAPKVRSAWSNEHIAALLGSPIYHGSATVHRRWKPGWQIVRDSIYWARS